MKKALVCFVEGIEQDAGFGQFVQEYERLGYEPFVFFDVVRNQVQPSDTLLLLEHALGDTLGEYALLFVSNVRNFFILTRRLYHETYAGFLFYYTFGQDRQSPLHDPIYHALLSTKPHAAERLNKPAWVFAADGSTTSLPPGPVGFWTPAAVLSDISVDDGRTSSLRKVYQYRGISHLFEPSSGVAVAIDLQSGSEVPLPDHTQITCHYADPIPSQVRSALAEMYRSPERFAQRYEDYKDLFDLYADSLNSAAYFERKFAIAMLEAIADSDHSRVRYFVLSFLLSVQPDPRYRDQILSLALADENMTAGQKYFVFFQSIRRGFVNTELATTSTGYLQRSLYRQVYEGFKSQVLDGDCWIPREQRNTDFMMVFTGQFLTLNHAPTKTALDRCFSLMRDMNKKVLLINTKELLTNREVVPFYAIASGNVMPELEKHSAIPYRDAEIPYYQPHAAMPDSVEIQNIVAMVRKYKPYLILSIGGANLTADICSNIVPVLNISTPYFRLPITEAQFPVIGRKATEQDRKTLRDFGFNPDNLIESVFTFDFKKQEHVYTREQLGLPTDKKLMLVVGYRLDQEVSAEFLQAVLETASYGTHLVFVGGFDFASWTERAPALAEHATNLGFQEDVLAVLDLCDIYVNPKRAGGGTSVVEAMFKGIPAVTLPFGDVSTSVPDAFRVASYEEMTSLIVKYATDSAYYQDMSGKAKETAEVLMNTQEELKRIIAKAESSPDFQ